MKGVLLLSILTLFSQVVQAESRTWTDRSTKKTIQGEAVDTSMQKDKIQISLDTGKTVWIPISRLIDEDQKFVKTWVKPENHISTRILSMRKGRKEIGVLVRGGSKGGEVVMYPRIPDRADIRRTVKSGEEADFTFTGSQKWLVRLYVDKKVLDEESASQKTGLRDRRR